MTTTTVRPYDAETDDAELWALKRAFELGLGSGTGGEEKREKYEGKLDVEYRENWLDWVDRCCADDERAVQVAVRGDGGGRADHLQGYVFVLPDSMSFIWDSAVLNEIFVQPEARGTGVADDLMDAALDAAREQDLPLDRMVLDVDRENERAKSFYDRHDFDHWGELVAREL